MDGGVGRTAGAAVGGIGGQGRREMAELAGEILVQEENVHAKWLPSRRMGLTADRIARMPGRWNRNIRFRIRLRKWSPKCHWARSSALARLPRTFRTISRPARDFESCRESFWSLASKRWTRFLASRETIWPGWRRAVAGVMKSGFVGLCLTVLMLMIPGCGRGDLDGPSEFRILKVVTGSDESDILAAIRKFDGVALVPFRGKAPGILLLIVDNRFTAPQDGAQIRIWWHSPDIYEMYAGSIPLYSCDDRKYRIVLSSPTRGMTGYAIASPPGYGRLSIFEKNAANSPENYVFNLPSGGRLEIGTVTFSDVNGERSSSIVPFFQDHVNDFPRTGSSTLQREFLHLPITQKVVPCVAPMP
jgi:hypothetical protein